MSADGPKRLERPLMFMLLSAGIALLVTGTMLVWAQAAPERVLIGLEGRHDHDKEGNDRLATCLDCHVPFVGTPGSRCLGPGCHGDLATGTPPKIGSAMPIRFHAALRDQPCGLCHEEHVRHGSITSTRSFSHSIIPSATRDRCSACHTGQGREGHAATDAVACDLCHSTNHWIEGPVDHKPVQQHPCDLCHGAPADDRHASVAGTCNECHNSDTWKTGVAIIKKSGG